MYDGYLISILHGALLSIQVALGALVVAIVLGLAGATAKLSSHKPLIWLGGIYSTIIRGIPDLVLMHAFIGDLICYMCEVVGGSSSPQCHE